MLKLCFLFFFALASALGHKSPTPNPAALIQMKMYVVTPRNAMQVKSLKMSLEYLQNSLEAAFYVRNIDIQVGKDIEILVPNEQEDRFKHSVKEIGAIVKIRFNKVKLVMYNSPVPLSRSIGGARNIPQEIQDNNAILPAIYYPSFPHPRDFLTPEAISKQIKPGCVGSGKKARGETCSYHGECCSGMCYHGPNHPNIHKCGGVSTQPKAQNSEDNPRRFKSQPRDDSSFESFSDSSSSEGN